MCTERIIRYIPRAKLTEIIYLALLIYCYVSCRSKVIIIDHQSAGWYFEKWSQGRTPSDDTSRWCLRTALLYERYRILITLSNSNQQNEYNLNIWYRVLFCNFFFMCTIKFCDKSFEIVSFYLSQLWRWCNPLASTRTPECG